jgi:phosphatidylserine decarboxylase
MRSRARAAIVILALVLAACGASARERTIKTTFVGLNAARDGFIVWDAEYQKNVVNNATSYEVGKAALTEYRNRREIVVRSLAAAYRAIAAAAIEQSDADAAAAVAAAIEFYHAVEQLTGRPPARGP